MSLVLPCISGLPTVIMTIIMASLVLGTIVVDPLVSRMSIATIRPSFGLSTTIVCGAPIHYIDNFSDTHLPTNSPPSYIDHCLGCDDWIDPNGDYDRVPLDGNDQLVEYCVGA